ncbi:unnamed protein product [Brassicogethes aeneus]|uniref:Large ribosomal subunit protein uL18m n=1 Tax=Brassicogethes aeneus TaxID=1431903 RepID=A0A9P0AUC5_BRAAE|nr:unnamed protein product [Brassicogethes aeneus]
MINLRSCTRLANRIVQETRNASTKVQNSEISPIFTNRNPRNLEKLRIAYKPDGYHVDAPGKCYWHKLHLTKSERYVSAYIEHFENGAVVKASTSEWALKKFLYRYNDTSAYINLGRVLAQRCLESGLAEIRCDIKPRNSDGKVALFLKAVQDSGIKLEEATQYKPARPWDQYRQEKPWEVTE